MRRTLGILIGLGAIVALFAVGTASAQEAKQPRAQASLPTLVAVAIGQLKEADGGSSTIDLRAGLRDGQSRGNLRFYDPAVGYYNGAVRSLSLENDTIKASGAGGLFRPDGTRIGVRYLAEISTDGQHVSITVQGRNGYQYALSGRLDPGLVRAGSPQSLVPTATRSQTPLSSEFQVQ
ncbi:MAG: hypothetical protein HY690_06175 [Chloroflexi bacterium]|nr:hypothetical protein [Chloroflexota bacterium]